MNYGYYFRVDFIWLEKIQSVKLHFILFVLSIQGYDRLVAISFSSNQFHQANFVHFREEITHVGH